MNVKVRLPCVFVDLKRRSAQFIEMHFGTNCLTLESMVKIWKYLDLCMKQLHIA